MGSAYSSDPQFRSLVFLEFFTLLGGTVFYSTVEGWSIVDVAEPRAPDGRRFVSAFGPLYRPMRRGSTT